MRGIFSSVVTRYNPYTTQERYIGMVNYEARRKKKNRDYDQKACEWCNEDFKPKRESQKYCDPKCRYAAWFDRTYERKATQ